MSVLATQVLTTSGFESYLYEALGKGDRLDLHAKSMKSLDEDGES